MFREGGELVACLLAGVAMLNNRVAGTFSRNEDVYQDPATGNWFTNRPREAAPLYLPPCTPEQPRLDPSFTLLLLSPWQRRISLNFRATASMEDALKCRCETTNRPTPPPSSYDETFVPWICKRLRNTYSDATDGGVARMVYV